MLVVAVVQFTLKTGSARHAAFLIPGCKSIPLALPCVVRAAEVAQKCPCNSVAMARKIT